MKHSNQETDSHGLTKAMPEYMASVGNTVQI